MIQNLNDITYDIIYDMFCIQGKTYLEISNIFAVSRTKLAKHINSLGIHKHTYQDDLFEKRLWKCSKCNCIKDINNFKIKLNKQLYKNISNTCIECDKTASQKHYTDNKNIYKTRAKKYREDNPEKNRELSRKKIAKSRQEKPHVHRLKGLLSRFIKATKQNKSMRTTVMVGYSYNEFKSFVDNSELPLQGNHVDHKCPISWMMDNVPPHIANSLSNLQIISENENETKSQWWSHPLTIEFYDLLVKWIKDEYKDRFVLQGEYYVDIKSEYYNKHTS